MVKIIITLFIVSSTIYADNIYERNCVNCHQKLPASLHDMFKHYLLVYSGERNVKAGLKHYLQYPSKDISVMSKLFIDTYPIKNKSTLSSQELDEIIAIYWEKYKVFGRLK